MKEINPKSDPLLREINQEMQAERLQLLWKRHADKIIGGVITVLIAAAAGSWYADHRLEQRADANRQYEQARKSTASTDPKAATSIFKTLADADADSGYGLLSRFQSAANNSTPDAAYLALSNDNGLYQRDRDLALTLYGYRMVDAGVPAAPLAKLSALAASNSPWQFSAREIIALDLLSKAQKSGADRPKKADVASALQAISEDSQAPQAMQQRATQILLALPTLIKE